jgi:hypothetical protein
MAIVQISQIQVRRGLQQDLPQLASGELGWSLDSQRLFIGNGTLDEGAAREGLTEILTEHSSQTFNNLVESVVAVNNALALIQSDLNVIQEKIPATALTIPASTTGSIRGISSNNAIIAYTLTQGVKQRTGRITMSYHPTISSVDYDEEYTETAATDLTFNITANSSAMNFGYSTVSSTSLMYSIQLIVPRSSIA